MNLFFKSFLYLFVIYLVLNFIVYKFNIFKTKFHNKHQKLIGKESIPHIGGFIFLLYILIYISNFNHTVILFSIFVFIIGFLSDINFLNSPNKRLSLQLIIILVFLYFYEYRINDLRIDIFNNFFTNYYFKLIFTAFCVLILINGSNFIDGSNGLNLGYFFSILVSINYLILVDNINFDIQAIHILLIGILFLLILNFFNYLYLGDSGAYLVSFIVGSILIQIHYNNTNISPYFIALLLWYPAFENFFSIIRKKINHSSPLDPDINHLHQLIFKFLNIKKKMKSIYANQLTSVIIVAYNLIIFIISLDYINKTNHMILILIVNVIIYLGTYNYLKMKLQK